MYKINKNEKNLLLEMCNDACFRFRNGSGLFLKSISFNL